MKKQYSIIAALIVAIIVLGAYALELKNGLLGATSQTATVDSGIQLNEQKIYDSGGVRVTVAPLPQTFAFSVKGQQASEGGGIVQVLDGKGKPMTFEFSGDVVPFVEMVTDDFVVIPTTGAVGGIRDVYVADRKQDGRLFTHYTFPNEHYLAISHDAKTFVVADNKSVILLKNTGAAPTELKRFLAPIASQAAGGSMSPGDTRFAFMTSTGTMDQPTYHIAVFSMTDGSVKNIGDTSYFGEPVWKDAHTIEVVVQNLAQGTQEAKATFTAP